LRRRGEFAQKIQNDPIAVACCRILNDFRPLDRIVDGITADASGPALDRYLGAALAQHCFYGGVRYEILIKAFGAVGANAQFEVKPGDDHRPSTGAAPLGSALRFRLCGEQVPGLECRGILRSREAVLGVELAILEQVALLNLARYQSSSNCTEGLEYLEDAVVHARHAVAVEHHAFPLTTLGKVLLNHMIAPGMPMKDSFDEAFKRLSEAIAMEERRNRVAAQPYGVIFSGVVNYVGAGGELTHQQRNRLREILTKAATKLAGDREMHQHITSVKDVLG
jgi:hypothetical protein